jgi:POT family proton-dependent oligopeptide transporter
MTTTEQPVSTIPANGSRASWFGEPPGLTILFLTNMWETFSFFGMRALLVYYLTKQLAFDQAHASLVYGTYGAFVYFTPIFGGLISDRWLGRRRAILLGGSIMALGHFMMAFPSLLYPALAAIAFGNGFYLPNLPSQIDRLYAADDPRRGSAYNVYYVGINIGGFVAPFVCGTLGELYGWHLGFGAAGVGMCLGLAIYTFGSRWLPPEPLRTAMGSSSGSPDDIATLRRVWPILAGVFIAVVIFRGAYEQVGNTIALWADADVDRHVGSFLIPGSWFQSLNPLLVFVFTPFLIRHWTRAARNHREPTELRKMSMGAAGVAAAFLILVLASLVGGRANGAHWLWLTAFLGIYTISELHILPIGLGLYARLAPNRHRATMIAAWFFASFAGAALAGALGTLWRHVGHAGYFLLMAAVAGTAALLLRGLESGARSRLAPARAPSGGA